MTPNYEKLYSEGQRIREHVLGTDLVRHAGRPHAFNAGFQEVATALAWGGVWTREGLALRDRSLVTLAVLAALGRSHELGMHIPGAIRNGLTIKEIEEAFIHLGLYAGFPATVAANRVAQEVLDSKPDSKSSEIQASQSIASDRATIASENAE